MIIAVSSYENNINSQVDPRFGRAAYFMIFDENNNLVDTIDNTASGAMAQGAGINSATMIAKKGVNVLITGSVGPKALAVLEKAGIKIIEGMSDMNIIDALNNYKNKNISQISSQVQATQIGTGYGAGQGLGMGGSPGCGRGMGSGRGRGGGGGMGKGGCRRRIRLFQNFRCSRWFNF